MPFVPVLIAIHVALAVSLLLPSILLPFALRARRPATESGSPVVRVLLWFQANGSVLLGIAVAITGIALVLALGVGIASQPWLLVALGIYAANLVMAFFVQRPSLRRLVGVRAAFDDALWQARARRQRYISYVMAGLTGTIGVLMSTKPDLW